MIILTESLLDSTWEKPGQPSNHCYVWSTCELIIEVLKCKVSLLRITNMPLTPWDLRFFRKTKSCFLSSMFFLELRLEDSIILDPNLKALFTHARNMKNKFMFIYTDDVGVSVLIFGNSNQLSNAGDNSWSWIRKDFIQLQKEEEKFVVVRSRRP